MRVKALAFRLLDQIRHDKRTIALVVLAPLIILTIIYFIFNAPDSGLKIGIIKAPDRFIQVLEKNKDVDVNIVYVDKKDALSAVKNQAVTATVNMEGNSILIDLDNSDAGKAQKAMYVLQSSALATNVGALSDTLTSFERAMISLKKQLPTAMAGLITTPDTDGSKDLDISVNYIYGKENASMFDKFGAPLVGIIVFFLTFLIAGINFLTERTSGALEKLLSTPIRRWEIVTGYAVGFGTLAVVQSVIVTLFIVYALGLSVAGSIWYVLLITLLTALCALTLGMLFSSLANSEFQMVQFIPVVILPQIFLCGIFDLAGGWDTAGHFMPLYYTAHGLKQVMILGKGIGSVWIDISVLAGCCALFMILNTFVLKKQRKM